MFWYEPVALGYSSKYIALWEEIEIVKKDGSLLRGDVLDILDNMIAVEGEDVDAQYVEYSDIDVIRLIDLDANGNEELDEIKFSLFELDSIYVCKGIPIRKGQEVLAKFKVLKYFSNSYKGVVTSVEDGYLDINSKRIPFAKLIKVEM